MNQKEEKINELLLDNRFVDWLINPQSPYAEYWLQWIKAEPGNAALAEQATTFLLELRMTEASLEKEVSEEDTAGIWDHIRESIGPDTAPVIMHRPFRRWYWVAAAAFTGLVLLLATLFVNRPARSSSLASATKENQPPAELVRYNGGDKNELFFLPDGSKITLAKDARISYNRLMSGNKREVYLSGEAFFEVAKNPQKPFYIYTQKMVIKVLGTSFRVTASEAKESVAVRTGKVSVYLKGQDLEQSAATILLPRQVCTYFAPKKELVTGAYTAKSKIELEAEGANEYNFEDAPLETVLTTIERMYSLPVHYDKQAFSNCFITVSLGNESLEEKLEVITKTVGASFSISDYGINIEGKGCNK
jgi:ferric-dicitrate binding protein FerR (iron transport regulator)